MDNPTYVEVLNWASSFLEKADKESYIAEYLILERKGWQKTELLMNLRKPMPLEEVQQLEADLALILKDYPPQYIIGSCEFYGRRFEVSSGTLIPRPETEELVALVLTNNPRKADLSVLDIGTGTGAIALSLKGEAPDWQVSAVDLSLEALVVAEKNRQNLALEVAFYQGDLTAPVKHQLFDIIVSNPPYISYDEWAVMDESVRQHEPKLALFADHQGLKIYERLAEEFPLRLKATGKIYLEIGYQQGQAVQELFQKAFPDHQVLVHQDLQGQDRMISVER